MNNEEFVRTLLNTNLNNVSDEVLKIIALAVARERHKRKIDKSQIKEEFKQIESGINKFFTNRPKKHDLFNPKWLGYLTDIINQDWVDLFNGCNDKKYYVYFHHYPTGNKLSFNNEYAPFSLSGYPFYVGKGTGDRAYDLNRNQGHGAILKQLKEKNFHANDIVRIIKNDLTESEALELESKFIYFFGTKYEKGRNGILVNLDIPKRPDHLHMSKHSNIKYK